MLLGRVAFGIPLPYLNFPQHGAPSSRPDIAMGLGRWTGQTLWIALFLFSISSVGKERCCERVQHVDVDHD